MENEILKAIKHIKDISRKNVTLGKIEAFTKKNNIEILTDELNNIIENMVTNGIIIKKGEDKHASIVIQNNLRLVKKLRTLLKFLRGKKLKNILSMVLRRLK